VVRFGEAHHLYSKVVTESFGHYLTGSASQTHVCAVVVEAGRVGDSR